MTQLTEERFEEILTTKIAPLATKNDVRQGVEELALIVKKGFDGVDSQLSEIVELLDVRKDVSELKIQMQEIRHALNLK